LSIYELEYIKDEYIKREKQEKNMNYNRMNEDKLKEEEDDFLLIPLKERSVEKYINPFEIGWEERYYKSLFNIKINEERRKEICLNYLEGLEWTMKYYTSGCVDWRWTYKYDYPPLLCDLIKFMPYFDTCLLDLKEKNPVLPLVQLSYVLPKSSQYLLPDFVRQKLKKKQKWYDEDCEFKWSFCKFFWEGHVCLPDINITELEDLLHD
jgi:5'-3' exonuclease